MVRVCGPQARLALEKLTGRVPPPRQAALARVRDPDNGDVIDEALALWFPGPHSETGEDMAELQLHGGPAVIAAVFAALGAIAGFRPAEPGEFTRRAFDNGKLDLTEAEGLADLIAAETPAQRRAAFRQLKGQIGDRAEAWRARIIEALALVEAGIDFSDEADVPENLVTPALLTAQQLRAEIASALGRWRTCRAVARWAWSSPSPGRRMPASQPCSTGWRKREAAIVSPLPGTTRDVIEVHLDLGGYPVTLLDTAGMHEGSGPVEQEGIRRAKARAEAADLVLWVTDGSAIGRAANNMLENPFISKAWQVVNKLDLAVDKLWISSESAVR